MNIAPYVSMAIVCVGVIVRVQRVGTGTDALFCCYFNTMLLFLAPKILLTGTVANHTHS